MSGWSGCYEFLFLFSSAILLFEMKSLFFSLWTNICQILCVIFESTNQFSFKFCNNLQCNKTKLLCTFFSSNIICFGQNIPLKCKFSRFWVLWRKIVKFLMSSLNWKVKSSSNFASFFILMTHNSPVNFKLIHFLLWIKGPNKSPKF